MYILIEKTHNGEFFVHLGPIDWKPRRFQSIISDDLEIDFQVPISNNTNEVIIVNEIVRIVPVIDIGITATIFNTKIQQLIGPYYNFYDTYAEMYFNVQNKPISTVKAELKLIIATNRYKYENIGVNITIQNQSVIALTNREDRSLYLQAYQLSKDNINWKFGNNFLTLSNADLGNIVNSVANHVQSVFDWEHQKQQEIDNCSLLTELDLINVLSDNPNWEPNIVN